MNEEEKDAIEKLTNGEKITFFELIRKMKKEGIERFIVTRPEYIYIILNLIEKLQKENKTLKEYITIAPNLDEMTATKYRNIQQEAYMQGRAEEQRKAEQIIYENYISKEKIRYKIKKLNEKGEMYKGNIDERFSIESKINILQELIEESEEKWKNNY